METASLWIAIVSAAFTGASVVVALIARADSKRATADAAAAQIAAATSAERAASATEKLATIQSQIFDGPPWSVEWFNGDTFIITNNSPVEALNVEIDGQPDNVVLQVDELGPRTVGARSAFTFMFAAMMNQRMRRDVVVTWQRPGNSTVLSWSHPIPARPKA